MTSTTKEQRDTFARLLAECDGDTTDESAFVMYADEALPALLSDSERLAAIEAVTGEEVNSVIETIRRRGLLMEAIPVIFSLSAKVAEQAEEIERLRGLRQGPHTLGRIVDELLSAVDESTRLRRLLTETAVPALDRLSDSIAFCDTGNAGLEAMMRRGHAQNVAMTIRAQMEG